MPDLLRVRDPAADGRPAEPIALRSGLARTSDVLLHAWAAPLIAGREVLEVSAARGRGAAVLREGGAERVVGLGPEGPVLEALAADGLQVLAGEAHDIPLGDAAVDVAVWADAPAELAQFVPALDELRRVVRPTGHVLIALSLPDMSRRDEEPAPSWLAAVANRFPFVTTAEARSHAAAVARTASGAEPAGLAVTALDASGPPDRLFVAASSERFDPPPDAAVLAETADLAVFERDVLASRDREIGRLREELGVLGQFAEERERLLELLEGSERSLAALPDLHETIDRMRYEAARLERMVSHLEQRLERGDRTVRNLQSSASWKLTRPLRAAKDALRGE